MKQMLRAVGFALLAAFLSLPADAQNTNTVALITLVAQGAGTVNSADIPNAVYRGGTVGINLTTATTATVVVHIQGKDVASGQYYDILVGPSLTTTGFTPLTVYPGILSTSTTYPLPLPGVWRVEAVVTGGSAAVTGTIDATLIQ